MLHWLTVPDKSRIVEEGNWWKFTNSKEKVQMKEKLLETGDRELVEVCVRTGSSLVRIDC